MQINRLFEMVYILLQKEKVTAQELAERFEVSTRTIYRDVEVLSGAGIPIYTTKGKGGGIGLMSHFVLDRSLLSHQEQQEILMALEKHTAVLGNGVNTALEKLSGLFQKQQSSWLRIDLTPWGHQGQVDVVEQMRLAILQKQVVVFDYYSSYGQASHRRVRPVQLWFKHRAWYLVGFCEDKQQRRVFKLSRIRDLKVTEIPFQEIMWQEPVSDHFQDPVQQMQTITLLIAPQMGFRVLDEYHHQWVRQREDGYFVVEMELPVDSWVIGHVLSYGSAAQVLHPPQLRDGVKRQLEQTLAHYLKE